MTDPCSLVIFGSTGNLAGNKLLPALYHLESGRKQEGGQDREDTSSDQEPRKDAQAGGLQIGGADPE
ncbi:MAG: hypothetical protein LJE70_15010, partial [Chromatiaceae bacterium]|nr:hypothetical protein [Chromatiaceae bacterium]